MDERKNTNINDMNGIPIKVGDIILLHYEKSSYDAGEVRCLGNNDFYLEPLYALGTFDFNKNVKYRILGNIFEDNYLEKFDPEVYKINFNAMFISKFQIKSEKELENGYVEVQFEREIDNPIDIKPQIFSKEVLQNIKSDEPSDASDFRNKFSAFVAAEILKVLLKHNVPVEHNFINFIFQTVSDSFKRSYEFADDIKWGNPMNERTMLQVHETITSSAKDIFKDLK